VAGALLALPGNILDVFFMSVIFFIWIERIEQTQRRRERAEIERELSAEAEQQGAEDDAATIDATD
jgi:hypothetical protein